MSTGTDTAGACHSPDGVAAPWIPHEPGGTIRRMGDEPRLSRRKMLGLMGAAGGGAALAAGGYLASREESSSAAAADEPVTEPFHGTYQGGVLTPQQKHLSLTGYDLEITSKEELRPLMRAWTDRAALLAAGGTDGIDNPS